jgi:hypothetical protein
MRSATLLVLVALVGCGEPESTHSATGAGGAGGDGGFGGEAGQGGVGGAGGSEPTCAFDTMNDPAHCGGCDNPCAPGQSCALGSCQCAPDVVSPDWSTELMPLFQTSCADTRCHEGPFAEQGLELVADPHAAMVGVVSFECGSRMRLLVEPGHPERSHVMDKLLGVRVCSGIRMPPDDPLPAPVLRDISDWICAGAPL